MIVPSAFLGNVVRGWGVRPERIEVVPNAIRHAETPGISRDDAKARLGLSGRLVILSASRLVPWKGFDKLIRLAAGMKGDLPEVRWVIAGTGPCEASLRKLSREVGSEEAVVFAGRLDRDAMSLHLAACDLFVLWSGYEGLSHVLLEAMGAGRAVIASDAGGNPEVLEGGRGGVLVPLGDEAGLARTLRALCRDSVARERLEREARAIVTARFAWPSMVRRTLEVLESAAGGA